MHVLNSVHVAIICMLLSTVLLHKANLLLLMVLLMMCGRLVESWLADSRCVDSLVGISSNNLLSHAFAPSNYVLLLLSIFLHSRQQFI